MLYRRRLFTGLLFGWFLSPHIVFSAKSLTQIFIFDQVDAGTSTQLPNCCDTRAIELERGTVNSDFTGIRLDSHLSHKTPRI